MTALLLMVYGNANNESNECNAMYKNISYIV